jgi:hypothetical protein
MASKTLPETIDSVLTRRLAGVHVSGPGRVTRVASDGSAVDVQPLIGVVRVLPDGDEIVDQLPIVVNCPVVQLGGGAFVMTMPVAVGDTVLLVFADKSLDRWFAVGGQVDPGDYARHGLSDAVAIPGLHDLAHALDAVATDRITLGAKTGMQIHVTETQVQLGAAAATQGAGLGTALQTWANDVYSYLLQVNASLTSLGAPPASTPPLPPTLASTTVKVKP